MIPVIGRKIYLYDTVSSTNDLLKEKALLREEEGAVVVAEQQLQGHGRFAKNWHSPRSLGLYFSVLLRPDWPNERAGFFSILSSLAIAKSLQKICGVPIQLKWPNDVLLQNKKVCGVLLESHSVFNRLSFLVIGMGINVHHSLQDFPLDLQNRCTSILQSTGKKINKDELLEAILHELNFLYAQIKSEKCLQAIVRQWNEMCCHRGKQVRLICEGLFYGGRFTGINERGSAIIAMESGQTRLFDSADFSLQEVKHAADC
jgi:BirA family transcriptional regulator, biotin operon repressor / biotin---[acetyl-CoA-carboxylase] ligase